MIKGPIGSWKPSREFIANVIANTCAGLYDADKMKQAKYRGYFSNNPKIPSILNNARQNALNLSDADLQDELVDKSIFVDAYKYDLWKRTGEHAHIKTMLNNPTYSPKKYSPKENNTYTTEDKARLENHRNKLIHEVATRFPKWGPVEFPKQLPEPPEEKDGNS